VATNLKTAWLALAGLLLAAAPSHALDVKLGEIKTVDSILRASIELHDVVSGRFKKTLEENGMLHLRVQAELWESRPVWDRLVYPAIVRALRMTRGSVPPDPMPMTLDLGASSRVSSSGNYYVHVIATVGTLAEREAEEVGDAVFGRAEEANGLGSLGRLVMRTAVQVNDYLQRVTSETRSRKMSGADLIRP
jgi:hypothetical protein